MIQCPYCHKDHVMKNYIDCNLCEQKTSFYTNNDGKIVALLRGITYYNVRYSVVYEIYNKRVFVYSNYDTDDINKLEIKDKNYFIFTYENDMLLINKYIKNINIK